MKILVIDDSLLDRKLLVNSLTKAEVSQEIIQANNGKEGLDILKEHYKDICLIFLDWQMPEMDGIQFMKAVLQDTEMAKVPIIMISATGGEENKAYIRSINPDLAGYLVKPYSRNVLIEMMTPYLD